MSEMDRIQGRTERVTYNPFEPLPEAESFPRYFVHFLLKCFKYRVLSLMVRNVTVVMWSEKCWEQLYGLHVGTVLPVECQALGVTLKKSLSIQVHVRTVILEATRLGKRDVVEYYYESLVYEKMTRHQHETKTYWEPIVQLMQRMRRKGRAEVRQPWRTGKGKTISFG